MRTGILRIEQLLLYVIVRKHNLLFNFFIDVELIYNVVLITAVQESDSIIHIYTFFKHNLLLSCLHNHSRAIWSSF